MAFFVFLQQFSDKSIQGVVYFFRPIVSVHVLTFFTTISKKKKNSVLYEFACKVILAIVYPNQNIEIRKIGF